MKFASKCICLLSRKLSAIVSNFIEVSMCPWCPGDYIALGSIAPLIRPNEAWHLAGDRFGPGWTVPQLKWVLVVLPSTGCPTGVVPVA